MEHELLAFPEYLKCHAGIWVGFLLVDIYFSMQSFIDNSFSFWSLLFVVLVPFWPSCCLSFFLTESDYLWELY